jgi:hypothetical protein
LHEDSGRFHETGGRRAVTSPKMQQIDFERRDRAALGGARNSACAH